VWKLSRCEPAEILNNALFIAREKAGQKFNEKKIYIPWELWHF
jgi:hypothetical protein